MNVEEISKAIPDLRKEAAELRALGERKIAEGQSDIGRAVKIESLIALVQSLYAPTEVSDSDIPNLITEAAASISQNVVGERLSGIPAIRKIMQEDPNRIWTAKEMFSELSARGWVSTNSKYPKHSVETGLGRMAEREEVHRVSTGRFRYGADPRKTQDLGNTPSKSVPTPEQALPGSHRERSREAPEIVGVAGLPGDPLEAPLTGSTPVTSTL